MIILNILFALLFSLMLLLGLACAVIGLSHYFGINWAGIDYEVKQNDK